MKKKLLITPLSVLLALGVMAVSYYLINHHNMTKHIHFAVEKAVQDKYPDAKLHSVEYFKKEATITGVSDPKYYLWVYATLPNEKPYYAAIRVAAVTNSWIEVLQMVDCERLRNTPTIISRLFPTDIHHTVNEKFNAHC